jgi:hypothetical protein
VKIAVEIRFLPMRFFPDIISKGANKTQTPFFKKYKAVLIADALTLAYFQSDIL